MADCAVPHRHDRRQSLCDAPERRFSGDRGHRLVHAALSAKGALALAFSLTTAALDIQRAHAGAAHPCYGQSEQTIAQPVVRAGQGSLEFIAIDGSRFEAADVVLHQEESDAVDTELRFFAHPIGPPNRWGRAPAWIEARQPDGTQRLWQEFLLENSIAVFAPRHASAACAQLLLSLPQETDGVAGAGKPRLAEATTSLERLSARAGTYVIVQGRLISLGKTERTRYLNFGRNWSSDLTATISVKDEPRFADWLDEQGFSFENLPGKALELRGYVTVDRGPKIELTHPAQLRVLGGETARP